MFITTSVAKILSFLIRSMYASKVDIWSHGKRQTEFQTGILKNISQHDMVFFMRMKITIKPIKHA